MKLRTPYWLMVIVWHLIMLTLAYFLLKDKYYWFVAVQIGAGLSLLLAYKIYRDFQRPLDLIKGGRDALQDRDFSVKYRLTGIKEVDALVGTYNDMIDTLRTERTKLQEQQYLLEKLIEASPSGIFIMNHDGQITEVNPRAKEILGFDPLIEPDESHLILEAVKNMPAGTNQQIKLDSSQHFRIEVGTFIDRGFQRKFVQIQSVTQEILAAEKRAFGKVIRMMAHEVNNSIGAVNALLQTFSDPDSEPDEEWVKDVRENLPIAIERNQRLNVFMRNFANVVRLPAPNRENVDLNQILQQTVQLFQHLADQQQTALSLIPLAHPFYTQIDAAQFQQVLGNIMKNALEAVQQGGEIRIQLNTEKQRLTIADNGTGLSDEVANAIFTPFFTTKSHGQGIGLTLIRDILNNHELGYKLSTDKDGWTRFVIQF